VALVFPVRTKVGWRLGAGVGLAVLASAPLFAAEHGVGGWLVLLVGAPVLAA
jgi:hypothetical protein